MFIIRPSNFNNEDLFRIKNKFLFYLLNLEYYQQELTRIKTGAAQGGINLINLSRLQIPVPPIEIQQQIVSEIEKLEKEQEDNEREIENGKAEIQNIVLKHISYEKSSLGKIYNLTSGSRPKGGATNDGVLSIGGKHLQNGRVNLSNPKFVPKEYANKLKGKGAGLMKFDVLMCKDGALSGKTAIVDIDIEAVVNEHVFIIRPLNTESFEEFKIKNKYLFYLFNTELYKSKLQEIKTGSAQGGINSTNLKNLPIPVPPLAIQKQIVNEIEQIESEINQLEQRNKEIEELKKKTIEKYLFS